MLVVKLGGSLASSASLRPWLDAIATARGPAVLVPGGGPFAEAVRAAQPRMGFSDAAAHAMAMLAMAQYGFALASLAAGLVPAAGPAAIAGVLAERRVPVWTPLQPPDALPVSWEVTSDSLALWLAGRLGAAALLLVKSRPAEAADVAALSRAGLLDAAFPGLCAAFTGRVFVAGPDEAPAAGLDAARPPGLRVH
jgi:aspartokinase-like uncharacterized kinase